MATLPRNILVWKRGKAIRDFIGIVGIPPVDTTVRPLDESSHCGFKGRTLDDADVPARPAHQEQPILFARRCARRQ